MSFVALCTCMLDVVIELWDIDNHNKVRFLWLSVKWTECDQALWLFWYCIK